MLSGRNGLADLNIPPELLPLFLQAAMQGNGGTQSPFQDAPPSRQDAAVEQSLARWNALGTHAANNPAGVAENFGLPGLAAATVLRAKDASDRSGQRGMLPLGSPRKQDAAIPDTAQVTAGQEPAPQADILGQLMTQKSALQAEISGATKERDAQAKSGRGPKWQSSVDTANALIGKMDALDAQIANEQKQRSDLARQNSPEYQRMIGEGDKAATARDTALANKRQSYEEFMPQSVQNLQAWLPMATAAGIHGVKEAVNVVKNNTAAGKWVGAIDAANATKKVADKAKFGDLSAAYAKEYPAAQGLARFKPYGVAAAAGAGEGAVLSNTPEIYNSFLPAVNQERTAWQQYLDALPADHPDRARAEKLLAGMPEKNPIKEAAIEHLLSRASLARGAEGAMEGAIGATTAKTLVGSLNPTFPRPEAVALAKELRGADKAKKAADAAKAEKAAAKAATLEGPSTQPPMITTDPQAALPPPSAMQPQQLLIPRMTQGDDTIPNDLFQQIMQRYMTRKPGRPD